MGTRSCVPAPVGPVLRRPRLETLLGKPAGRPVTLLAGPPGIGKTTLLSSYFGPDGAGRDPVAWLTLYPGDDRPGRLGRLLSEALHRSGLSPRCADADLSDVAQMDQVFESLAGGRRSGVLVLDEAQELTSPSGLAALSHLAEYTPPELRVVVAARADPPIRWERLSASGRLRQIRWSDLAFTEGETIELLAAHGMDVAPPDATALWRRTEGWAVGLHLVIDALHNGSDPHDLATALATTEEAITAYLFAEVLGRRSREEQDLLLHTSVTEEISSDLAVALTGDTDAGSRLHELFRQGVFLTAVEGSPHYRYHPLFRQLLQTHLARRSPDLVGVLHHRAVGWYLRVERPEQAEKHARAAEDWGVVGRLLLQDWIRSTTDHPDASPETPLAGIPMDTRVTTPELAVVAAADACRWAHREEADLYRDAVRRHPDHLDGGAGDRKLLQAWRTALLITDASYGWAFGPDDRSRAAVARLRKLPEADPSTVALRQLAVLGQANEDIEAGALDRAHHRLTELVEQGKPAWPHTLASSMLAVVDACSGALLSAGNLIDRVGTAPGGLPDTIDRDLSPVTRLIALASLFCEAQKGGPVTDERAWLPDETFPWSSPSTRAVQRVARIAGRGSPPHFVSLDRATAEHPLAERALLALGVLEVLDPAGHLLVLGGRGERVVLEARRRHTEGRLPASDAGIAAWLDAPEGGHPRTTVEASVLATIAADARNDAGATAARLQFMFDMVRATGIVAPLRLHAGDLRRPIEQWVDTLDPGSVPLALELLDRIGSGGHDMFEPLTDRELEILRRLPLLMSNAEIAAALHLSVNTVKTHLKAVYRKLGAHNRRTAIQRARELQVL
jgi:LuxR family transcriptional regulator, maltose regulon positive regulatory protein